MEEIKPKSPKKIKRKISGKISGKISRKISKNLEVIEELVKREGGKSRDAVFEDVKEGKQVSNASVICSLIKAGKISFTRPIAEGKYGKTILSEVSGLKKKEYVVKSPIDKNIAVCSIKEKTFQRNDGLGTTVFPKGSYICSGELSEFIISLYVGNLLRTGQSINFLDTYYFARCIGTDPGNAIKQYMFMEKADTSLRKEFMYLPIDTLDSLYIQLLHAIALIQEKYMIVHGDLHLDNILLKMGKNVCLEYNVGDDTVIYTPSTVFTAYPADWGMAVKYNETCVGNIRVLKSDFGDSQPNYFSFSYDVVYLTNSFMLEMKRNNNESPFIKKIYEWITHRVISLIPEQIYYFKKGSNTYRPKSENLDKYFLHVSAMSILKNADIMGQYMKKPTKKCEMGGILN